ncbi:MAG TPA: S41 family peptidase [Candidatus Anoxymicrobiaceae bacterium]|jgi:carboxyl-terminal processing protease
MNNQSNNEGPGQAEGQGSEQWQQAQNQQPTPPQGQVPPPPPQYPQQPAQSPQVPPPGGQAPPPIGTVPPQGAQYPPAAPGAQYGGQPYDLPPLDRGGKMSRRNKIILSTVIVLVVLGLLVGVGFVVDRVLFSGNQGVAFNLEASPSYQDALFNIKHYYYRDYSEAKITAAANLAVEKAKKKGVKNADELLNTGLTALIGALKDAHSNYLSPQENKRLSEDLSGSFYGVGFTLREDKATKRPKVVTVIKGSPSEKAGIKPNDMIMSVDGKDTKGEALDAVVLRIRGKSGTKVKLVVQRGGKTMNFNITREKISIPDFESEMQDGNIGVLKLYEFNSGVSDKLRAAVTDLQAKGAKGFILDLRNNPGGLLDEAVKVSSVFINSGPIISYQTKGEKKVTEDAQGGAATNLPLVVLTNGGSASSSEITAGALKDRGRATLVGSKTYGKGSVQKVFELENNGAAKLTIALYYLPNGESIDGKGIQPEVPVAEIKDNPEATDKAQMDDAKKVLNNLIQGKPPTGEIFQLAA